MSNNIRVQASSNTVKTPHVVTGVVGQHLSKENQK